jgi:hypothetical protein
MGDAWGVKSADVDKLIRAIRAHANRKEFEKELRSGLNSVTKDIRGQMIQVIPAALPRAGGLAALIENTIRSRIAAKPGKWAGVSLVFSARGHDIRTLTGRRLRHPVWGHRGTWVNQTEGVHPAVFMGEFDKQSPEIQLAIVGVLNTIARKVATS